MASGCLLLVFLVSFNFLVYDVKGFTFDHSPNKDNFAAFENFKDDDPCYDAKLKRPKACVPDFVNAAYGVPVKASSTCRGKAVGKNEVCDDKANGPYFLTDLHNPNNVTCWKSDFINRDTKENVTLTVSLKKKYELTYVSVHFCHAKPNSMAILKSMDHGKTWQPFQYYSDDCKVVFGKDLKMPISRANEQEPLCLNDHLEEDGSLRIAFSTLAERPSAEDFENSPVLQDWVTATDIRIVFPAVALVSALATKSKESKKDITIDLSEKVPRLDLIRSEKLIADNNFNKTSSLFSIDDNEEEDDEDEEFDGSGMSEDDELSMLDQDTTTKNSLLSDEDKKELQWVGVSDLAIGGRCKCNGHASECTVDRSGEMSCNCKHNTAGKECEKCKSFHFDRPWGRATSSLANECVACKCNNHARRCRFNMELFQLSGGVSGGVCLKCKHNTAGRHCHYCKEGYFRNAKKPITHNKACEPCNCHPVGSSGKICNQTNGQCPCKDGVTGRECNRCARGYQQSGSPIAPCIKVPRASSFGMSSRDQGGKSYYQPDHAAQEADSCADCRSTTKRVTMRKYCSMDYVYLVSVKGRQGSGDPEWSQFRVEVEKPYKKPSRSKKGSRGLRLRKNQMTSMWIPTRQLACGCPQIKPGLSYLVLDEVDPNADRGSSSSKYRRSSNVRDGLVLDKKTVVIEWRRDWGRRMKRFKKRSRKACRG